MEPALAGARWAGERNVPMSELEPDDSRDVTNSQNRAPGEPPRTGPREGQAHAEAGQQAAPSQSDARQGFATEGDSPEHPDRFSGTAATDAEQGGAQAEAEESDRWSRKADNSEDYVPEGK